jgi:hypothetical protein
MFDDCTSWGESSLAVPAAATVRIRDDFRASGMNAFWTFVLVDGVTLSAALTIVILGSLAYNPRLWIGDAPEPVRKLTPALGPAERRDRWVVAGVFLLTIVAATAWSAARLISREGTPSFATILIHFLGVFFIFNLVDLVVIDWLVLLVIRPRFLFRLSVPGLSYEETVGGYGYHFVAFLKGFGFITVMALVAASATYALI